jgi:hypothetical protein
MVFVFTIGFGLVINAPAQECGPGCPICSGSGSSTGALLSSGAMVSGYTVKSKEPIWSVRFQPIAEDKSSWRPAVILGTGSVQTGGNDQSVFIQFTKAFDFSEEIAVRFSIGAASLLPELDQAYFLANLTMNVTECWSPFSSYDGRNFHLGLSWIPKDWLFIAGLMVEMKFPAILVGYRWSF